MSKNINFKLNRRGVGELLKSKQMEKSILLSVNKVKSRAGSNYEVQETKVQSRIVAFCKTKNKAGRRDNLKNNTLLKALGSAK